MTETENKIMQFLSERESDDLYMLASKLHVQSGSGAVFAESLDACVDAVVSLLDTGKIERKAKELPSAGWMYSIAKDLQSAGRMRSLEGQQRVSEINDVSYKIMKQLKAFGRRSRRDLIKDFVSSGALVGCSIEMLLEEEIICTLAPGIRDWFDIFELTDHGRNLLESIEELNAKGR